MHAEVANTAATVGGPRRWEAWHHPDTPPPLSESGAGSGSALTLVGRGRASCGYAVSRPTDTS
jgi:hypothetical protein